MRKLRQDPEGISKYYGQDREMEAFRFNFHSNYQFEVALLLLMEIALFKIIEFPWHLLDMDLVVDCGEA